MGVASYDNIRLEEIKRQLPTEKQIQQRIELAEEEFNLRRHKESEKMRKTIKKQRNK